MLEYPHRIGFASVGAARSIMYSFVGTDEITRRVDFTASSLTVDLLNARFFGLTLHNCSRLRPHRSCAIGIGFEAGSK